jgi:hypothetical protein
MEAARVEALQAALGRGGRRVAAIEANERALNDVLYDIYKRLRAAG